MNYAEAILDIEWEMFRSVNNIGGKAQCQDNYDVFRIMRMSQSMAWNEATRKSYYKDLINAKANDRNLLQEKYARMMFYTHSDEYDKISGHLPIISTEIFELCDKIAEIMREKDIAFRKKYPVIGGRGRNTDKGTTADIYLRGELLTYSLDTLNELFKYINELESSGENLVEKIQLNTANFYGYETLLDAENKI